MVIPSCLLYFVEHTAQPEAFSSIPATIWWAVSTFTTIGYGDIVPITAFGKALPHPHFPPSEGRKEGQTEGRS